MKPAMMGMIGPMGMLFAALIGTKSASRPSFDQELLRNRSHQAEAHLGGGLKIIAHQRAIIAELERDGHDATRAWAMLETFEAIQKADEAICDRILDQLCT